MRGRGGAPLEAEAPRPADTSGEERETSGAPEEMKEEGGTGRAEGKAGTEGREEAGGGGGVTEPSETMEWTSEWVGAAKEKREGAEQVTIAGKDQETTVSAEEAEINGNEEKVTEARR